MIGFAPYDDPEIAVSVILTQGDTSYNVSPIVRDIVAKYFDLNTDASNSSDSKADFNKVEFGTNPATRNMDEEAGMNHEGHMNHEGAMNQETMNHKGHEENTEGN